MGQRHATFLHSGADAFAPAKAEKALISQCRPKGRPARGVATKLPRSALATRVALALAACAVSCSGEQYDLAAEPAKTQASLTADTSRSEAGSARTQTLALQGYPDVRRLPATYSVGDRVINIQREPDGAGGDVIATLRSPSSSFCNSKRCNSTGTACVAASGWDCTCLELPDGPWCFHFPCEGGGGVSGPDDESGFPSKP